MIQSPTTDRSAEGLPSVAADRRVGDTSQGLAELKHKHMVHWYTHCWGPLGFSYPRRITTSEIISNWGSPFMLVQKPGSHRREKPAQSLIRPYITLLGDVYDILKINCCKASRKHLAAQTQPLPSQGSPA